MNYKLIMLPQPILVVNEKPNINEFAWDAYERKIFQAIIYKGVRWNGLTENRYFKAIAGLPDLPKLDLSLIADKIGWVDVEKLAKNYVESDIKKNPLYGHFFNTYMDGFKAAQSLNEKKYTKSDVIKAMEYALENQCPFQVELYQYFIDDLSKPKEYNVEVEMEINQCDGCISGHHIIDGIHKAPSPSGSMVCKKHLYDRPKITNNTIKVLKIRNEKSNSR